MIEILSAGVVTSIQDLGREGHLDIGVGVAGAMDRLALQSANLLLGNPPGAAAIETAGGLLRLRFTAPCRFAITGAPAPAALDGLALPSWWCSPARAGQVLEIAPSPTGMWTYLALAGGIDVPRVLGSCSTDLKSGFGGLAGRALQPGDHLHTTPAPPAQHTGGFGIMPPDTGGHNRPIPLRAIPAREHALFSSAAQSAFWTSEWIVQRDSNRIGYRLQGPALELDPPLSLLSYGLVPGLVQIPPSGQPVVQLSEANTCGGYPKMAVIIAADLRRLAQTRPGSAVRFIASTREQAIAALHEAAATLASIPSC